MIPLRTIRDTLVRHPVESPAPSPSMAAVALALAGGPDALSLCFIRRSTRPSDRWSGQMAFPGGKAEPHDPTARAVAVRETREEVDLHLDRAECLGALPIVPVRPVGGPIDLMSPHAFYVGPRPPPLRPNAAEVDRAFWIPLHHLWDERNRDSIEWEYKGRRMRFPGVRFGENVIWGLTFRVLTQWSKQLGVPLPGADDQPVARP